MGRIEKAYRTIFREALERVHARRIDQGLEWLETRARRLSDNELISPANALTRVYEELSARVRSHAAQFAAPSIRFYCDAGLGGLARWLRAAGYEAFWQEGIDDGVLVQEAHKASATLLTTDSLMMERRLLRDHVLPALWLPPTMKIPEQLSLVFREFGLTVHTTRCMDCGGELLRGDKETLRDRIPPRTYRWLDDYFVCSRCGKLFWHGSHWEKIQRQLLEVQHKIR